MDVIFNWARLERIYSRDLVCIKFKFEAKKFDTIKMNTNIETKLYSYIYIYIYVCVCVCVFVCVCVCVCVCTWTAFLFIMHISLKNIDMFCLHIFVCPFQLPNRFYGVRRELVDETTITNCYPSAFCTILGHHQGCVYSKRDRTFACTLLLCKGLLFILVCCCSVLFVSVSSSNG